MPDDYDFEILFGEPPGEKQRTLAKTLARQRAVGRLGLMGNPLMQRLGNEALKTAAAQEKNQLEAATQGEALRRFVLVKTLAAQRQAAQREQELADIGRREQFSMSQQERALANNLEAARIAAGQAEAKTIRTETRAEARRGEAETRATSKKAEEGAKKVELFAGNMFDTLTRLEGLVKRYGTTGGATGPGKELITTELTQYATDAAKLLDPESVAREGEVALQMRGLWEPGISGLKLTNDTALALIQAAKARIEERRQRGYRARDLIPPAAPSSAGTQQANRRKVRLGGIKGTMLGNDASTFIPAE